MMKMKTETRGFSQAGTSFVNRVTTWALLLALTVLHPLPARTLYHCRVTGVKNLPECCCKGKSRCCEESVASGLSCCEKVNTVCRDGERRDDGRPFVLGADSCGCCEVTYEEGSTPVSAVKDVRGNGLRQLREFASFLAPRPSPPGTALSCSAAVSAALGQRALQGATR